MVSLYKTQKRKENVKVKFVCRICGYVYDEAKERIPFAELPDTWKCPLCGAKKSDFEMQGDNLANTAIGTPVEVDESMLKLSIGQMAALCSNLARGCEKQYKYEAADKYKALADYFSSVAPEVPESEISDIANMIENDLEEKYKTVRNVAGTDPKDRGALRVCVWGEKVSRILKSLIEQYEAEGEAFLENTEIWVCTTCGFVWVGNEAPKLCPVCKVPDWKFEKIEGRA